MMMMYVIGNSGVTDLQLQKLHQLLGMSPQLLLPQLHQQKGGIFLSSAVRIRQYFWTWLQCEVVMFQNMNLTTDHFSGKFFIQFPAIDYIDIWTFIVSVIWSLILRICTSVGSSVVQAKILT